MIIVVDFDGTLALGNKSHITLAEPNYSLIQRLQGLKREYDCIIKIVTARGGKGGLSLEEKEQKYTENIKAFLHMYKVPYDVISYQKEYGHIYIDDMTISQTDNFEPLLSPFTKNKILFTEKTVIKNSKSALFEFEWYKQSIWDTPNVLFCNDEIIITQRVENSVKPTIECYIEILNKFKKSKIKNYDFTSYVNNLVEIEYSTPKTKEIIKTLPEHQGTFFHGDFSTTNVLGYMEGDKIKTNLIDPNYKNIFGSYLTDAGKLFFSLIAYEYDYTSAERLLSEYGKRVIQFAVAEGIRVCKYKPKYITIVNNIADLYV